MCAPVLRQLAQVAERDMLTGREGEVLQLLAKGQSNKSIARGLDIAVGTVKTHVQSIMSKLDAGCRTEAVSVAIERGLVELPESLLRHIKPHAFAAAWQASAQPELVQA
ncbi:two-component response regulator [Collimonas arenae]|uniref:Two-component response regulator n=2 Tax=Collimonas arenae TaxID=279058 RepID=A0A0A1FFQ2_9BURK|nr:two-component response regulator [Collimonas arenae]